MSKTTTLLFLLFFSVSLNAQVKADFGATGNTGCSPVRVNFTDNSLNAISWYWDLGNGNISTVQNPQAIYNTPGKYTVTLIVSDVAGKKDTLKKTDFVVAYKIPTAGLSSDKKEICAKEQISFKDVSTPGDGTINNWTWDFGDGGTANTSQPVATYLTPGVYDVTLSVKDNYGCKSESKNVKLITVNELPEAKIKASLRNSCKVPQAVTFGNAASNTTTITLTRWQFGDAKSSTEEAPSHTYNSYGSFKVTLEVINSKNCVIKVTEDNLISIQKPSPDFTVNNTVCINNKVQFTNNSTPKNDSVTWYWDFGDGGTSIESAPAHIYTKAGSYNVKLSMAYGDGCYKEISQTNAVNVLAPPTGSLPNDTVYCFSRGQKIKYQLKNPVGIDHVDWYVNGNLGYTTKPDKDISVPTDPGVSYKIVAMAFNSLGCGYPIDSCNYYIDLPLPKVQLTDAKGCVNRKVKGVEIGTSKFALTTYNWSGPGFKDLTSSEVNFDINTIGKFPVALEVTDIYGCKGKDTTWVYAGKQVEPFFESTYKEICSGEVVKIINKTPLKEKDSVAFEYIWNTDNEFAYRNKDSVFFALGGYGGKIATLTVKSDFYGCKYTKSFPDIKFKIKGPKTDGRIKADCLKDSLVATNLSEYYTSFNWKYVTRSGQSVTSTDQVLYLKFSDIQSLGLYTYNNKDSCNGYKQFSLASDPNSPQFSFNMDCNTRNIEAVSQYEEKIEDSSFHWKLKHLGNGTITLFSGRKLVLKNIPEGKYSIELQVNNIKYVCPRRWSKTFMYYNWPQNKPKLELNNTQCYPIDLKLTDNSFGQGMVESYWNLNKGEKIVPITTAQTSFTFRGIANNLTISLYRKDSFGCSKTIDTIIKLKQKTATIARKQKDESCDRAVITFFPSLAGASDPGNTYQYFWDFGHRKSTSESDTLIVGAPAEKVIKLLVRDKYGCESVDQLVTKLGATRPIAKFGNSEAKATCPPLKVTFEDQSEPGANSNLEKWEWDFGDGTKSEKQHPFKMYIYPGTYSVQLTITNNRGCKDVYKIPDLVVLKGPNGTYFFDKKQSCTPLDVKFWTTSTANTKIFEFDLADGEVVDKAAQKHTYARPGMYIPRLILTDSTGCRFTLPPKDTLYVYPNPEAKFDAGRVCAGKTYTVKHQSELYGDSMQKVEWWVNNSLFATTDSAKIRFYGKANTAVTLAVETRHGCKDTFTNYFSSFGMKLGLETDKRTYCLGQTINIMDVSKQDTVLKSKRVWINNNELAYQQRFAVPASSKGNFGAMLVYEDVIGCTDTWKITDLLKVGDTLPPPPLKMYRATVLDDYTTEARFAKTRETDFDSYRLHYFKEGKWEFAQIFSNPNDTNIAIGGLNTLHNSYCHKISQTNYCEVASDLLPVIDQCTIETRAIGDTNCAKVDWSYYTGWNKVKMYRIWRKKTEDNTYSLIDSVEGAVNHYVDSTVWCHIVYDYKIEGIEEEGNLQNSFSDSARATPIHFVPVPAPEVWRATVENNEYARVEWIMPKTPIYPIAYFSLWKRDHNGWILKDPQLPASTMDFNDTKTEVQASSYLYKLTATDICQTLSPESNPGKTILLNVKEDKKEGWPILNWNSYLKWNEGVDHYRIERSVLNAPFAEVGTTGGTDTQFVDKQVPLHCVKDIKYRVVAVRNQPATYPDSSFNCVSVSNHRPFVPELRFFIPNAFTPDGNNLNEGFAPKGIYYFSYHMKIYNRWGEKVFEGTTCNNTWEGFYNGIKAMSGVYAYSIEAVDYAGKVYNFAGTVHLLK